MDQPQVTKEVTPTTVTINDKVFTNELTKMLTGSNDYRLKELTEAMIEGAIIAARDGDVKAAALIIERVDGKMLERVEITADDETKQLVASSNELLSKIRKIHTD